MALITGNQFANLLRGTNFDDDVFGFGGNDTLIGRDGADLLDAGRGDDDVLGGFGADIVYGRAGWDDLEGGGGRDSIYGHDGRDEIDGEDGVDLLVGGTGRDDIEGGRGGDILKGGQAGDRLDGGAGDDLLTGGGGRDVFEFETRSGDDIVADFRDGADRLDLRDFDFRGTGQVLRNASQIGEDVIIDLDGRTSATLFDVDLADLGRADFLI
jgi:Ca2+-binding RTX toxin-like protein